MDYHDDRIKFDNFQNQTTYRSDYKKNPKPYSDPPVPPKKVCLPVEKTVRKFTYIDNETMQDWREGVNIPYNLLWRPKEIIETNPRVTLPDHEIKPDDPQKAESIKTRPRLYMSPAVSIDDVPEPKMRELLLAFMYTTDWRIAEKEAVYDTFCAKVTPSKVDVSAGDNVKIQVNLFSPLPPTFRNKGKEWEGKQIRVQVDPTKEFWLTKDPPVRTALMDPTKDMVSEETKSHIRRLLETDMLRLPHDLPIVGYAGYRPISSETVPLCKVQRDVIHPFLSVSQAITKRYEGS